MVRWVSAVLNRLSITAATGGLLLFMGLMSACTPVEQPVGVLPTRVRIVSATPPPPSETPLPPSHTPTDAPTATITDTPLPTPTFVPSSTPMPSPTITVTLPAPTAPAFPTLPPPFSRTPPATTTADNATSQQSQTVDRGSITRTPLPRAFRFGMSANGNELRAYRQGDGDRVLFIVGGIHAGFEANTVDLVTRLRDHFRENPRDVLPGMTLIFIPSLNPDGLEYGRQLRGRFNGNEVDLNRNWGCGWSEDAFFNAGDVDPGSEPFSEPETRALGGLIQQVQPDAVLFYHAAANGIYSGNCEGAPGVSDELAAAIGEGTGYPYGEEFSSYQLTGTASAWVDSIGIPAVAVELSTAEGTEFSRNLVGIVEVQRWLTGRP